MNKESQPTVFDRILTRGKVGNDNSSRRELSRPDELENDERMEDKNGKDGFNKKNEGELQIPEERPSKKRLKSILSSPNQDEKLNLLNEANETGFMSPKVNNTPYQEADLSQRLIKMRPDIPEELLSSAKNSDSQIERNGEDEYGENNKSKFFNNSEFEPNESADESRIMRKQVQNFNKNLSLETSSYEIKR
jgi:hypothetical protein